MKFVVTLLSLSSAILAAAPQLHLASSSLGPIYIATGQNGPTQSVAATNTGSGSLSLSASADVAWINASVSAGNSIEIALATSSLAAGQYTGTVAVSAPGAIDAPQNITVTVQIGSPVPNSLDLYVAPGGSASTLFLTATGLLATPKNPPSGPTLSVVSFGGTFISPTFGYSITANAPAGAPAGDYPCSVITSGSKSAADNKTISITIHVTTQPVVAASPTSLTFRLAPGEPAATQAVVLSNLGQGTLSIVPAPAANPTAAPPPWLTESTQGTTILLTANPGSMMPGPYQANIIIVTNAANPVVTIPVELDVLTPGPPVAYYQGVLDNALFAAGDPVAPGGIVALFGEQLADSVAQAQSLPLGDSLGGASVTVNGVPAPIYYASPGQLNFVIPYATAAGTAVVQVQRGSQTGNSVSIHVKPAVPRLLPLGIDDYGIAVLGDTLTFAIPTTAGIASRPAQAGTDTVVFYALGLGDTNPFVIDGQASPLAQIPPARFVIGESILPGTGVTVTPAYAGLTPGSVGLYQINVAIPSNAPRGDAVPVYLDMGGGVVSNRVDIAIQ